MIVVSASSKVALCQPRGASVASDCLIGSAWDNRDDQGELKCEWLDAASTNNRNSFSRDWLHTVVCVSRQAAINRQPSIIATVCVPPGFLDRQPVSSAHLTPLSKKDKLRPWRSSLNLGQISAMRSSSALSQEDNPLLFHLFGGK